MQRRQSHPIAYTPTSRGGALEALPSPFVRSSFLEVRRRIPGAAGTRPEHPIPVCQQPDRDKMGESRQVSTSSCRAGGVEGWISRSEAIPLQPLADAGGGREDGAEADGTLGDQHDHALRGLRQFACAGKHSRGTGSRRLTNATGNKPATGRKQEAMIRGGYWDNLLKIKDQVPGLSRPS